MKGYPPSWTGASIRIYLLEKALMAYNEVVKRQDFSALDSCKETSEKILEDWPKGAQRMHEALEKWLEKGEDSI